MSTCARLKPKYNVIWTVSKQTTENYNKSKRKIQNQCQTRAVFLFGHTSASKEYELCLVMGWVVMVSSAAINMR